MSYEPVDVYVKQQASEPVEGVIVRVFNPSGSTFYTQQTTDADGKASFLLFTQSYSMRFYKFQATFSQPQQFEVLAAPEVNAFNVTAEVFTPPIANDARLCRCWGYFRDPDGSAQEYLDMHFYPEFSPIILEGAGVVPRKMAIRTDDKGYAQIDLIRGGCYRVTIEGQEHEERYIRVPDLSRANLPNVLYPIVKRVAFDPPGPYELALGAELEVTPTVYDSAGATLTGTGQNDVNWKSSDTDILGLQVKESTVVLRGAGVGTANILVERRDQSIISIPSYPIEGQPLEVTVS
jgi:hypothetical protein